ncbi:hypothetical protein [Beijerinckia sp. L45]|uniref:hypothetical protein n=1 Tax=Beijerinckia sp. L45 TaxID=1641855 RepID=UPI00131B8B82|nr:hypothetical protein [Beijerinckia sp. L45]
MLAIVNQLTAINVRLEKIEASGSASGPLRVIDYAEAPNIGLPSFDDMVNLELTFFDNGKKQGKAQFNIKAEVNVAKKSFKERRDVVLYADLYDFWEFPSKLNKRKTSLAYREAIMETLNKYRSEGDAVMIGMFSAKGGTKGTSWYEDQYIVVRHNGERKILDATLYVNGDQYFVQKFDTKVHPKTGKPFALDAIKGKAIEYPRMVRTGETD